MEWTKFNTHGESENHAFEVMCNLLFQQWCYKEYKDSIKHFMFVNGRGGDGGVEAYAIITTGEVVGVQAKWFDKITKTQINEIKRSFISAISVRPQLSRYVVCIPRDLTSKKRVSRETQNIAKNTEDKFWEDFVVSIRQIYPKVKIDLWDETNLQKLLISDDYGIRRYWFENTELFDNGIITAFNKAKLGWAKTNYIPDLFTKGKIHEKLESFVGSIELIKRRLDKIENIIKRFALLKKAYEDLLYFDLPKDKNQIVEDIKSDIAELEYWREEFEKVKGIISIGINNTEDFNHKEFHLKCSPIELERNNVFSKQYFHFRAVEDAICNIEEDVEKCRKIILGDSGNLLVILGNPGVGKTAGIIGEAELMFEQKSHLPIIVHAKDFYTGDNWATILEKTLGISLNWDEQDLFHALSSAALLRKLSKNNIAEAKTEKTSIQPKCVIYVDGIDEAHDWKFWKDKINEVIVFENDFPYIKFVFLSRPYVFDENFKNYNRENILILNNDGDVSVRKLFDKYVEYYQIQINGNYWIKQMLRTPIALKLFCELYKNKIIENLQKNSLVITELYKEKFKQLEEQYRLEHHESSTGYIVQPVLISIADLLVNNKCNEISVEEIWNNINEQYRSKLNELLVLFKQEGFLYSRIHKESQFDVGVELYSFGIQPVFDYLIGQKLFERVKRGDSIEIKYINGAYKMFSLILLENAGKLLDECSNITVCKDHAFDLICYSLANASIKAVSVFEGYVRKLMGCTAYKFRKIFERVIVPVSQINEHPLGCILLDRFLRSFASPAFRDIWWSVPSNLWYGHKSAWNTCVEIDFNDIEIEGKSYKGRPLLFAWSLSSLNNGVRYDSRLKLITWGIANPLEFFKLLVYFSDINDEQILEDLFAVAYGISLSESVNDEYLKNLSEWILNNVFSSAGLIKYENVAIRYFCRGIVEIAISKSLLGKDKKSFVIPPYKYNVRDVSLYASALDSGRMVGYGPIGYDLSRYVLWDHVNLFLENNYSLSFCPDETNLSKSARIWISTYKKKFNKTDIKPEGLIIAMAYQYLLNCGWEISLFSSGKGKDDIGIDTAIRRTYQAATHGLKSKVMTVAEKYVWIFRHRIQAVLCNVLRYGYGKEKAIIKDYAELESFTNAYQDFINENQLNHTERWLHLEQVAVPSFKERTKDNITKWILENNIPDFNKWIFGNNKTLLYSYTNVRNEEFGIEETLFISSGAMLAANFDVFVSGINRYFEGRFELYNTNEFYAYIKYGTYCTPQEICSLKRIEENNNQLCVEIDGNNIVLNKLVLSTMVQYRENNERTFIMPSKFTRKLVKISYGDGYNYKDQQGKIIGEYTFSGKNWETQQNCLLIDSDILSWALEKNKLRQFWLFKICKRPSAKGTELFGTDSLLDNYRTYFVWFEDKKCRSLEIKHIQKPMNNRNRVKIVFKDT